MPADKYLALVGGRKQEVAAAQTSAGVDNAGDIVALDDSGRVHQSMMPVGVGPDTSTLTTSEALSAGAFINVWNDAGIMKMRNADATTSGKECDGFVLDAVLMGQQGLAYHEGRNTALSALSGGARYYLSATPGSATTTPPSAAGNVVQYLGRAIGDTTLNFEPDDGVIVG